MASLTPAEKEKFLCAVVQLKNTIANPNDPPSQQISIYDQFVGIHLAVTMILVRRFRSQDLGHRGPAFLPWHREYLLRFERALQEVSGDDSIGVPYWDWTDHIATENVIFQPDYIGPNGGPTGTEGGAVASGYFAGSVPDTLPSWWAGCIPSDYEGWKIRPDLDQGDHGAVLIRNLADASGLATDADINALLRLRLAKQFWTELESGERMHGYGHGWVGGHMTVMTSPNDPIFFCHHSNVDRLWAEWQDRANNQNKYPRLVPYNDVGHGLNEPMWPWDGGAYEVSPAFPSTVVLPDYSNEPARTAADVMDHRSLGYAYDTLPATARNIA